MRGIIKFIFGLEILLSIISFTCDLQNTEEILINSFIMGIFVSVFFMIVSELTYLKSQEKIISPEELKIRKKIVYLIAFFLFIVSILVFLNFYLYVKALLGSDLLISLDSKNKTLIIENGGEGIFNLQAKVLTSPFCQASCLISLKDLSNGNLVYNETVHLSVSSPLIKEISISTNEETSGQTLYEASLWCETLKESLCYTKTDYPKSRTQILSINHELNSVQKARKEKLKNQTESLNMEFSNVKNSINKMNLNFSFLDLSRFENISISLNESLNNFSSKVNKLNSLYENQEYSALGIEFPIVKNKFEILNSEFKFFNSSVFSEINLYNLLIENISLMHKEILFLEDYNFSSLSVIAAESFVNDFNSMISNLTKKDILANKIILLNVVEKEKEKLLAIMNEENFSGILRNNKINVLISEAPSLKIKMDWNQSFQNFSLAEPQPICCFENECFTCINNSFSNYPVLFIHGHSFNKALSLEASFESFNGFSQRLEKDGYINAGELYSQDYSEISKEYLGKVNSSVVIKGTYYLDFSSKGNSFVLSSDWSNINIYVTRLREIISNVKYLTGKEKVILVSHSMGGLVVRRYIQRYGDEDLDKVILITVPNKGVDGFVIDYCSVFGANTECAEMDKNSLFIKNLNEAQFPKVPIYNIIGLGCNWENSVGDGIVKNESAYLEGASNIYFKGTCNGLDFFHSEVLDPNRYPKIYEKVKELIEN